MTFNWLTLGAEWLGKNRADGGRTSRTLAQRIEDGSTPNHQHSFTFFKWRRGAAMVSVIYALGVFKTQAANTADNYTGDNTGNILTAGNWSLSSLPTVADDAVFNVASGGTGIRTMSAGNLTVGSFNVMTNAGTFSIRNQTTGATDSILTLGGSGDLGNSITGTAGDLLYVASGATFNVIGPNGSSGSGVIKLVLGQSGNFDAAGTMSSTAVISDGGGGFGFTKSGGGKLTLSAVNTYSGNTTISGGTLALGSGGSIANSPQVSIAAGATFDVSASGFTFTGSSPVQTLAGGSTSGTATINAPSQTVTLSSGALLLFQAAGGGSSTVGKISVTGTSAALTLNNNTVTINVTGSALAAGSYRLLDCTGTLTGSANSTPMITGTVLTSGYTATVSTMTGSAGHVDLIVKATPVFSGLTATPSITYGATSITLSGTLSSTGGSTTVYPANGDIVSATINGHTVNGSVNNTTGGFSITYNDTSLKTDGVGSSPYTITYAYAGNSSKFLNAAASDTSTSLTVNQAALTVTASNVTKPVGLTLTGGSGSTAFTSSGLVNSETIGSVTIAYGTGAAAGDAIGNYTSQVTPSAATGGTFNPANYAISYVPGNITVTPIVLAGWDMNGQTGFGTSPLTASASAANTSVGGLTRGLGVTTNSIGNAAGNAWGGNGWNASTEALAIAGTNYATFTVQASSGHAVSFNSVSKFYYRTSGTGATNGALQYSTDGTDFTDINNAITYLTNASSSISAIDLSSLSALQNVASGTTVTFRIVNWNASSSAGNWYINDGNSGDDFEVQGQVTEIPTVNLASSANPSIYGADGVTFTATVSGNSGTPSGTVQFKTNSVNFGGAVALSSGSATSIALPAGLPANSYTVTAAYGGSAAYAPATSSGLSQTVNPLPVTLTGSRVYDGTTTAAAAILSVGNTVGSDSVTVASGSGTLASANGGLETISSLDSLALGGSAAANYTLTGAGGSVRINPATGALTITTISNTPASFPTNKLVLVASDAGVTLSVTGVSATSTNGGTVSLNGTTITYTPVSTFVGTDSFTYTLGDNMGGSTTGTVGVTVNFINATNSTISSIVVVPGVSATVTASGIPNTLYKIQASDDSGSSWNQIGTATTAANGVLTYIDNTPNPTMRWYRLAQ